MSGEPQKACVDIENADSPGNSELILDLVMSYLPLEDCVRTSILSSRWRYRWTTIPSLVFDTTCCPRLRRSNTEEEEEEKGKALVGIVNHALSLHNGPIQNFAFGGPCIDIYCSLPPSLFTCGSLSSLGLVFCALSLPSSFEGFKNLKCLVLDCVALPNDAFEKMVSSCPLLEKLKLFDLEEADSLKINAPNLRDICIFCDDLDSITFEHPMTRLSVIHIHAPGCAYANLLGFFIKHADIQELHLAFCEMGGQRRRYLVIELGVWESNSKCRNKFEKLRSVNVGNFHGTQEELKFVEFVLGKSPTLEQMTVNPPSRPSANPRPAEVIRWEGVKGIYGFERASDQANIIFDGVVDQV